VSLYGWKHDNTAGFTARHPELFVRRGTIHLRPRDAAEIPDDELRDLIRAVLSA
jgi:hypothetical protein